MHEYLAQVVRAAPHIGLLGERAKTFSSRLSSGLSTWAQRLEMSPYRLHVKGTAGSGKTQLALEELKRARAAGLRSLYVCYNRSLADAMKATAPNGARVVTLHEMGKEFLEALGEPVDFEDPAVFDRMARAVVTHAHVLSGTFAAIVVDEAQDFEHQWIDALVSMGNNKTRIRLWPATASNAALGLMKTETPSIQMAISCWKQCIGSKARPQMLWCWWVCRRMWKVRWSEIGYSWG